MSADTHTHTHQLMSYELVYTSIHSSINESIHSSRAAAHCDIKIQRMNKRVGQRSVSYLGPITFNSLPKKLRGLDAKRVISQKVKIEFMPVLCCHVVDSSTLKVL